MYAQEGINGIAFEGQKHQKQLILPRRKAILCVRVLTNQEIPGSKHLQCTDVGIRHFTTNKPPGESAARQVQHDHRDKYIFRPDSHNLFSDE